MDSDSGYFHAYPSRGWAYLAASSVLPTFEPQRLSGLGTVRRELDGVLEMLMESAEPVMGGPAKGQWKLREDVRKRVIAQLSTRENIREAVEANISDGQDNPTTRAVLELVSTSGRHSLAGRSLEDLLGLDKAVEWLSVAQVGSLPSRADIASRIQLEKLLEPMRRLAVGFQGRVKDLQALRSYVDALPAKSSSELLARGFARLGYLFRDHPPFVIHGPGGAGKSTLVAKFILDHVDRNTRKPLAFVLLDFDRCTLDPTRPDALMVEIASQLKAQYPKHARSLTAIAELLDQRLQSEDSLQFEKSAHYDKSEKASEGLCGVMNAIAKSANQNLLFVVDTFEIVQRRGPTAVYSLLDFIGRFLSRVRRLRVVLVGRAELQRSQFQFSEDVIRWQAWPLKGFDIVAGRAYLRARLKRYKLPAASNDILDRLVLQVRGNPLGLRLVAQVFAREGASGVDEAIWFDTLDEEIAEEQIQGMLHTRIISHLDNEDLQRIASPGLIVRRLTVEVIREVLAIPCGLDLDKSSPETLFNLLQNEFALVEPVDSQTVRHRPDVRQIMLSSLRRDLGSKAAEIDDLAVRFWELDSSPAGRAEEIYHRLWRNDAAVDLDPRWVPDVEEYLQDAWDEFQTVAIGDWPRIWLAEKLGRELPDEIRMRAGQVVWERDVERKARALLTAAKPEEAIRVVSERSHDQWMPNSPLWILEMEALFLRGDAEGALAVNDEALKVVRTTGNRAQEIHVLARRVSALERLQRLEEAIRTAEEALSNAREISNRALIFACGVTRCRLATRDQRPQDPGIVALRAELSTLTGDPAVKRALVDSPALLREAVAELGAQAPNLIADALERFGLGDGKSDRTLDKILEQLAPAVVSTFREDRPVATTVAALIRQGQLSASMLNQIANAYARIAMHLATQILMR